MRSFNIPDHQQLQVTMSLSNFSTSVDCSAATISCPILFGAEILSLKASLVTNYSQYVHSGYYSNHGPVNVANANFCNVTISYTHPGQNDKLFVQVWLPAPEDTWNERLHMIGEDGWQAGLNIPSNRNPSWGAHEYQGNMKIAIKTTNLVYLANTIYSHRYFHYR